MSFCAVDDNETDSLLVIWDLGRRCTYTCSYCPPHRRNNWSPTASFDELVRTADSVARYGEIYNRYRSKPFKISCSFTGGEPTVNPDFFPFLEYLSEKHPSMHRTVTTNGFYSERRLEQVMNNTTFSTISYHCESTAEQKARVRLNMKIMHERKYKFKVNVMFHQDDEYFKECIDLCQWFDDVGISYTPRVIGDEGTIKGGLRDKTVHLYSDWQMDWLKQFWNLKNSHVLREDKETDTASTQEIAQSNTPQQPKNLVGQSIGRPCCGGRRMSLMDEIGNWDDAKFLTNNNFQGWNCMINWYFLYIHQEIDQVWHHQTCQVDLNGEVKPICRVSELDKYCDQLETTIKQTGSIPLIRCPKTHCGCGQCVPKARRDDVSLGIFHKHTRDIAPVMMQMKVDDGEGLTLRNVVHAWDAENAHKHVG